MTSPNRMLQPDTLINQATSTGMLAAADFSPGTIVAGRFKIARLLGMGGMGLVYEAHDTELDIDVALKLLRPELASRRDAFERFRQELLLARQVSSPYVVRIHDLVKHNDAWLISMDYVPGQSLERLLERQGTLPPEQAIAMTRQLALGLAAAHRSGVVHRDLKPANVLVNEQGDACITDFGVARSAGTTGITDSGVIIGTPAYLSPEQARAEPLDGRSDLYALGLILFEMLTGTQPFRGGTPAEMMIQRIVRDPPSATTIKPDLPAFVVRLCAHLLELKPAHRFQTAEEVVQAIDSRRLATRFRLGRGRTAIIASAILMLAIATVAIYDWRAGGNGTTAGTATELVASAARDIAVIPMIVEGNDALDAQLGSGAGRLLSEDLAGIGDANAADSMRVVRALAVLGYNAQTAQRQKQRVFDVIGVKYLVFGALTRRSDGLVFTLSMWQNGVDQAQWSQTTAALADAQVPAALHALEQSLHAHLGLPNGVPAWPTAATLRALGRLLQAPPMPEQLDAAIDEAQQSHAPALWWQLQESLDRSGRVAESAAVARRARDALAGDDTREARRTRAYAMVLLGETDAALSLIAPALTETPHDPPLQRLQARAQADLGNHDRAIAMLEQVVSADPGDVDAWYGLGKYAIQSGDAKRAVDDYLVRAQVLANRLNDERMQADVANVLGIGYRRLGQLTAAAERLEFAQQLRGKLGDKRGQANSLSNLATVRSIQGEFAAAEAAILQARTLIEPLGDAVTLAILINETGVLAEERGNYRDALAAYRDALRLRQSEGDARLIGESQINVGFAYYQLGEFDNAQTYWQQATATYGSIDDRNGIVHARESLGLAELARGDWAQARASLEGSLTEAESLQMAEERTISQASLAELDRLEGQFQTAVALASEAQGTFEQRDDVRGIVEMKLLQGALYCDLGDWQTAAAALSSIDAAMVAHGEQASQYAWREGEIALGRGDAKAALVAADLAIERGSKGNSYGSELGARLLRARALAALRHPDQAVAELRRVESGVARYASVPLRLLLAETSLQVDPAAADATYREARALLAHLPAYGRAFQLHARAAVALGKIPATAADARAAALAAWHDLYTHTPEPQRPALQQLAQSLGLDTTTSP